MLFGVYVCVWYYAKEIRKGDERRMESIVELITNSEEVFSFIWVIRLLVVSMALECFGLVASAFASVGRR